MRKFYSILMTLALAASVSISPLSSQLYKDTLSDKNQESVCLQTSKSECGQTSDIFKSNDAIEVARQGCCSWHGGVCGCSGGRLVCCDGSFSPSCGC